MAMSRLSLEQVLPKAQACRLDLASVLSNELYRIVTANADAIGVPPEFILYPLLTATASFMGTRAFVSINSEWKEPSIIWFIVAARKGEKKTAALKRIRKPIEEMEKELRDEWKNDLSNDKPSTSPQLIVDYFSFEERHSILSRNDGQVLGCFDEMSSFYGQLDLFKHSGSTIDRKTLLSLNGGGPWGRNFRTYSATVEKTAFNVTGFIQPVFVLQMLQGSDADGLNDRQFFDFPPERDQLLDELKSPMPDDIPDLKDIFQEVRMQHASDQHYHLDGEAYEAFRDIHDELVHEKMLTQDENAQGILSKARGYCARIAMVIHSLEQAVEHVAPDPANSASSQEEQSWNTSISVQAVHSAAAIVKHLNQQKFIMLGLEESGSVRGGSNAELSSRLVRLLTIESRNGDGTLHPSDVSQKHISKKVGSSFPTSKAVELMEEAERLGFGDVVASKTPNNRTVWRFRKRVLEELSVECTEKLKRAKVSSDNYNIAFNCRRRLPLHPIDNCSTNTVTPS